MAQKQSWGRYPKVETQATRVIQSVQLLDELPNLAQIEASVLPYGCGRSYGDSCLNEGGVVLDASSMKNFLNFDPATGLLRCEAGVTLAEIIEVMLPRGWFLPVSPGTKFVTVGGAIANDIHGKNHHKAGTFGCHLSRFMLLRSNGDKLLCSPTENTALFRATIGGLGLTGLILWAEFYLKPVQNAFLDVEEIRFNNLDEFFALSKASDKDYEYTVSWLDTIAAGKNLGRGVFIRGNHNQSGYLSSQTPKRKQLFTVPFDLPFSLLNRYSITAFNNSVYYSHIHKVTRKVKSYEPFFYPLDIVGRWNRFYGRDGLLQYQCVVPYDSDTVAMTEIITRIVAMGEGFLAVLKNFGDIKSPGMLSFPRPGPTLALDFPYHGSKTLRLMENLDTIVREYGGAVYPAKDARMSKQSFQSYYPNWQEFSQYIDPKFSSSFWRRVTDSPPQNEA